jgi:hypothetical protein
LQGGSQGRESRQGRTGLQADMQAARHGISGSEAGRQAEQAIRQGRAGGLAGRQGRAGRQAV